MMETLGAPGAGPANVVDTIFPFVPSEMVLPIAGFTAGRGRMSLASGKGACFYSVLADKGI